MSTLFAFWFGLNLVEYVPLLSDMSRPRAPIPGAFAPAYCICWVLELKRDQAGTEAEMLRQRLDERSTTPINVNVPGGTVGADQTPSGAPESSR